MVDWQHGYVTDMPYTFGFYKECAPNWMDWVALLRGSEPPTATRRVLELGCGQGFGICVMAAANPDYHFIGVDFNPEHIAHARSLVRRTQLKNVEFHEGDFVELSKGDLPWPECDYVVAHGILSWVHFDVRKAIFQITDRCLSPGGLAYFSYNSLPGWLPTHPVQHIMRQFADRTGVNALSFESAINALGKIKEVNGAVFTALPALNNRLEQLQNHSKEQANYMYHEYFNGSWSLFYSTQVADEAAVGKLSYLCSATIPDNFENILSDNMRSVLDSAPDKAMRELFKDMLINQSFRRDIFVRGVAPVWPGEQLSLFSKRKVMLLQKPELISLKFKTSFGEVGGNEEVYHPLFAQLKNGPITIAELSQKLPQLAVTTLLKAISLLAHTGAVGFCVDNVNSEPAQRFNQIVAESVSKGAPYKYLALPGIGSGIALDDLQWIALNLYYEGTTSLGELARGVETRLKALNKTFIKNGTPIPMDQGDEFINEIMVRLDPFVNGLLPLLQQLGGVPA